MFPDGLRALRAPAVRFAARLFAEHPDWRAFAEAVSDHPGEFAVAVPSPAHADFALRLTTGDGCVFCALGDVPCWTAWAPGFFGAAFDEAVGASVDPEVAEADVHDELLAIVRDVVAERRVLLAVYGLPDLGSPDAAVVSLVPYDRDAGLRFRGPGATRVVVRSWRGTHDAGAAFDPPPGDA